MYSTPLHLRRSREGIACFCHSHIRTLLFDGDTGSYMTVTVGVGVPPTLPVVASSDIVILAGFPGVASSRYSKSNVKVWEMMAWLSKSLILLIHHLTIWNVEEQRWKGRLQEGEVGLVLVLFLKN